MTENNTWPHVFAGICSGMTTSLVTCPLDVIKTRKQNATYLQHGTWKSLQSMWTKEGLRGMYRGLTPTLVGYIPTYAIYFPLYHLAKQTWPTILHDAQHPALVHVLSSMSAGVVSSGLTNPLWIIRTRLMTQDLHTKHPYHGIFDAARRIWQNEGLRGMTKGLAASSLGVVHTAFYFPIYERLKLTLNHDHPSRIKSHQVLLASTTAKVIASVAAYPHEVLRTRFQTQVKDGPYHKFLQAISYIYKTEGWKGFYRGLATSLFRSIPATGITFVTFEAVLQALTHPSSHMDVLTT